MEVARHEDSQPVGAARYEDSHPVGAAGHEDSHPVEAAQYEEQSLEIVLIIHFKLNMSPFEHVTI